MTFLGQFLFEKMLIEHLRNFSHLKSEAMSGYSQELRILPPNLTAQVFLVFEMFFVIFFKKFFR